MKIIQKIKRWYRLYQNERAWRRLSLLEQERIMDNMYESVVQKYFAEIGELEKEAERFWDLQRFLSQIGEH